MNVIKQNSTTEEFKVIRPEIYAYPALIHKAVMIASNKAGKRFSIRVGLGQALVDYVEMNEGAT